ncbi:hypothetical protein KCP71_24850 [Salmonella enterica subsp. enterica]|nr:hypothetical protein KCP71_24850 [Salmonella enterica subsp. enterica]
MRQSNVRLIIRSRRELPECVKRRTRPLTHGARTGSAPRFEANTLKRRNRFNIQRNNNLVSRTLQVCPSHCRPR